MKHNKIVAVVVTYNRKEMLEENLDALLSQTEDRYDILVIDNHSTDGTDELMKEYALLEDRIQYFDTGKNLGGAGGFAYGIRLAIEKGYSWLWLMDDDCMPKRNALEELTNTAKRLKGRFGFLSSKTMWKDGSLCRMNVQRTTLFENLTKYPSEKGEPIPIVIASFVSMFLPAKVVRRVGLPMAEFFIWTDDWEYSRRISRHFPCYAVPESEVVHETEENVGTSIATDEVERLWRYRYAYRNEVVLYRREGLRGMLHLLARTPLHMARVLLKAKDHRRERLSAILKGTWQGFWFFPKVERV
ncbi:MAG: glycosyltransferase family 2 protein [Lachnospiraceae bacterium]|nr:glycosyltransferase family 2 protein [Lachnospiraceae bacterium]